MATIVHLPHQPPLVIGWRAPARTNPHRSADQAPAQPDPYVELLDRMQRVLVELKKDHPTTDDNPNHAPAGSSEGGQFTSGPGGGSAPKADKTIKGAKAQMHKLLSSGHPFSKNDLATELGIKPSLVQTYLFMLKKEGHAGPHGALQLNKLPNGTYQVQLPDGTPAPAAPPLPDLLDVEPKIKPASPKLSTVKQPNVTLNDKGEVLPMTPHEGMTVWDMAQGTYEEWHDEAKQDLGMLIGMDGSSKQEMEQAVLDYKNAKSLAMAQFTATIKQSTKAPAKPQTSLFPADKLLIADILNDEPIGNALAKHKVNTSKDKAELKSTKPATSPVKPPVASPAKPTPAAKLVPPTDGLTPNAPVTRALKATAHHDDMVPPETEHLSKANLATFAANLKADHAKLKAASKDVATNKERVQQLINQKLTKSEAWQKAFGHLPISGETGAVARLISCWAGSSGGNNPTSCLMQVIAQDAFKLTAAQPQLSQLKALKEKGLDGCIESTAMKMNADISTPEKKAHLVKALHDFQHAQYETTQEQFKAMGITHMHVARGMSGSTSAVKGHSTGMGNVSIGSIRLQPASSFSTNLETAAHFASGGKPTLYFARVPVEQILGSYLTGYGCTSESEVVVLAHKEMKALAVGKTMLGTKSNSNLAEALKHLEPMVVQHDAAGDLSMPTWDLDSEAADWIKSMSWDLPPYLGEAFMRQQGPGFDIEEFEQSATYQYAVDAGLIVDGEWAAGAYNGFPDPLEDQPDPTPKQPRGKIFIHRH